MAVHRQKPAGEESCCTPSKINQVIDSRPPSCPHHPIPGQEILLRLLGTRGAQQKKGGHRGTIIRSTLDSFQKTSLPPSPMSPLVSPKPTKNPREITGL